jgi:hypothetical protein
MTIETAPQGDVTCADSFVSLYLYGDKLDPIAISALLGLEPSHAAQKGATARAPSGKKRTASRGYWILSSRDWVASKEAEDHLFWLLDRLESSGVSLEKLPNVEQAVVNCYWLSARGEGGPVFSAAALSRLAKLSLPLEFDFYSH